MKTVCTVVAIVLVGWMGLSTLALAADAGRTGANPLATQLAGVEEMFNRMGDWLATIGTSGIEKDSILIERRLSRAARDTQRTFARQAKGAEQGLQEATDGLQRGLDSVTRQ